MSIITNFIFWWYGINPVTHLGDVKIHAIPVMVVVGVIYLIVTLIKKAWADDYRSIEDLIIDTLFKTVIGSLVIGAAWPLLIVIGLIYGMTVGVAKWGKNYRQLERSKEKRREEVLRDMLNSDPVFMEKYNELMKTTPKI